jgi:hypothetical protein
MLIVSHEVIQLGFLICPNFLMLPGICSEWNLDLAFVFVSAVESLFGPQSCQPALLQLVKKITLSVDQVPTLALLALLYLARLRRLHPNLIKTNVQAMVTVSFILAQKYIDDGRWTNTSWAYLSNMDLSLINTAERWFLTMLNHSVYVSMAHFNSWAMVIHRFAVDLNQKRYTHPVEKAFKKHIQIPL